MDEESVTDEVKLNRIVFTDEVNKAIDQVKKTKNVQSPQKLKNN